jgi:hypothetical protein
LRSQPWKPQTFTWWLWRTLQKRKRVQFFIDAVGTQIVPTEKKFHTETSTFFFPFPLSCQHIFNIHRYQLSLLPDIFHLISFFLSYCSSAYRINRRSHFLHVAGWKTFNGQ